MKLNRKTNLAIVPAGIRTSGSASQTYLYRGNGDSLCMNLHAVKTERGYELADETGTLESLETSTVYLTKKQAEDAAHIANFSATAWDELRAMESRFDS